MNMAVRVCFLQPSVPIYRLDFFERLNAENKVQLTVCCGKILGGGLDIVTRNKCEWLYGNFDITSVLSTFLWQKNTLFLNIKRFDMIVLYGNFRCITNYLLIIRALALRKKIIWWTQYRAKNLFLRKFLLKLLIFMGINILFYTEREQIQFCSPLPVKKNVFFLNNGIKFYTRSYEEVIKEKVATRSSVFNILFFGRITRKSNFLLLLEALRKIKDIPCKLHVVGSTEDSEINEIRLGFFKENINILFHGAITTQSELDEIFNFCHVMVYPGDVGLSLIHSYACAIPVIIHDQVHDHMPEISAFLEVDKHMEMSFKKNDSDSLASVIQNFYHQIEDIAYSKQALSCYNVVSSTYNTANMAEHFMGVVKELFPQVEEDI